MMKKLSKEEVLEIVGNWVSINCGYIKAPTMEMDSDGNVFLKEDTNRGLPPFDGMTMAYEIKWVHKYSLGGACITLVDKDYDPFDVGQDFIRSCSPKPGDYFVVDRDRNYCMPSIIKKVNDKI